MVTEEEESASIPEWVVTFGDMMSLLLTFFIMLVSMSEIKKDEEYQAMIDSIREQFGHDASTRSLLPGESPPRNSSLQQVTSMGSAQRRNLEEGGSNVDSIAGEELQVQTIRPGKNSALGGVIYFAEDSAELTAQSQSDLLRIIPQIVGKPQKIEIRGHTSRKPIVGNSGIEDHWDLSYHRCKNVMQFLVQNEVELERIRLGAAGAVEPIDNGLTPEHRQRNARVEVLMWDERVGDLDAD